MSSKKTDVFYDERVLYDQYFNVLLPMYQLQSAKKQTSATGLSVDKHFPWAAYAPLDMKGRPKLSDEFTDANYSVHIDVQHFKVGEMDINIKKKNCVITAKHGNRPDEHGHISRSFTRTFTLPKKLDMHHVKSVISSDGVLTIHGPYLKEGEEKKDDEQTTPVAQMSADYSMTTTEVSMASVTTDEVSAKQPVTAAA